MKLNAYTVFDQVARTYLNPFYFHNDGEAKRMFGNWLKNPELPMAAHPEDYTLYHIGYYDTDTGRFEPTDPHNLILKGSSTEPTIKLEAVNNA